MLELSCASSMHPLNFRRASHALSDSFKHLTELWRSLYIWFYSTSDSHLESTWTGLDLINGHYLYAFIGHVWDKPGVQSQMRI